MGRILFVIIIAAIGWWCYETGIVYGIMHGFEPEPGRDCELVGPTNGALYVATSREALEFIISAAEIKSVNPMEDRGNVNEAIANGEVTAVPDGTRAKVVGSDWVHAGRVPYQATKVMILEGPTVGQEVWVRRDNVVDTPLQKVFAAFK